MACSETIWELAWERGIEPITQAALQSLKSDVCYMVGPDHVATFLGYPVGFVQVIAARLIESGIWAGDEVSSEPWLDPEKGMVSFILDLTVAEGKFTASWSEEKGQRSYYLPE